MKSFEVLLTIEVDAHALGDEQEISSRIRAAVIAAASARGFHCGSLGVLVTDDQTIHQINRDHLAHDYPTDVISFAYSQQRPEVEGELVVSWDTAQREAADLGWPAINELLLYVVHGVLHVCGMDDQAPEARADMRRAERQVLSSIGISNASEYGPDATQDAVPNDCADTYFRVNDL